MKKSFVFILVIFSVFCLGNSLYAMTVYTDKASFLSALSDYIIIDFEDYPSGANEIPFNGDEYSSLGVIFSHPADPNIPTYWQRLFIHSGRYWGDGNFLSPGQPPFSPPYNHDDLTIDITINAYAFGVDIVDNGRRRDDESITVYGSSGVIYTHDHIPDFFGIIADEPISSIFYDEHPNDGDDIGYDNIIIGNEYLPSDDSDFDGILDSIEVATETDPLDDDTDDDGLLDGPGSGEDTNANGAVDEGETDPRNSDTDEDGIQDGTEKGCTEPEGEDTDMEVFVPDADASTTTDPLNPDTDGDGLLDGEEDANSNGKLDEGETSADVYTVDMDICPEDCPNFLDVSAKGTLPVVILGTVDFDITLIDTTTLLLQGVPPKRWNTEDVTRPHECLYDYEYPDGEFDLTLKFDRQLIISSLGEVENGDVVTMTLTGDLSDGTPFEAIDSVVIVKE
jgi:hypothetical protein